MRKSIAKRIKITKTGKLKRRPSGLCHARANKSQKQILRKREERTINLPQRAIRKQILAVAY